jgi:glycosyltransferase involved in cell wall biosynthesis
MVHAPLLSIVIPTKNRYTTLFPVVKSIQRYLLGSSFEIVIQDNSDTNTEELTINDELAGQNIRYFYEAKKLSVTQNCNLGIENSSGRYLILIGDDDLVSPFILEIVSIMEEKGIESLIYSNANYYWKNLVFTKQYEFNSPASLVHPKNISLAMEEMNPEVELNKVLAMGGVFLNNLPCLYHGIVKRSTLDKVKQKFGSYIPGSSPDMAVAVALSTVLNRYYRINIPASIPGASKSSAAGLGVKGAHISRIEDVPWLSENILKNWDVNIPRIWTGYSIYAQSIHEVLKAGKVDKQLDYKKLYLKMFVNNYSTRRYVYPFISNDSSNLLDKYGTLTASFINVLLKTAIWKLPTRILNIVFFVRGEFKIKKAFKNVNSVEECMAILKSIHSPLFN